MWGIVAIIIGGLLALCCIGGVVVVALSGDGDQEPLTQESTRADEETRSGRPTVEPAEEDTDEDPSAGIGETVADGSFDPGYSPGMIR